VSRWKRKSEISGKDLSRLCHVCETTPGLTVYGNRARCSVMLPVDVAEIIAARAKTKNKTVNTIIVEMIEKHLKEEPNGKRQ